MSNSVHFILAFILGGLATLILMIDSMDKNDAPLDK